MILLDPKYLLGKFETEHWFYQVILLWIETIHL
jgi:hypothetical protein